MAIQKRYLDWSQPALPAVVDDLLLRAGSSRPVDLTHLIMVFPGQRAGRRFLEILVDRTKGAVFPPRILTVGSLPELLYEPKRPFACSLTQQMAWVAALKKLPADQLKLILQNPPIQNDLRGWLNLASLMQRQHAELAADQLQFEDIVRQGSQLPGFDEQKRWSVLSKIQQDYLTELDQIGQWDQQTARLVAILHHECHTDLEICTVGAVDLSRTLRSMLQQVQEKVTAYVHAPEEMEEAFDELGCLRTDKWVDLPIEIKTDQIKIVDNAVHQSDALIQVLTGFEGKYSIDEITVGVADDQLGGVLQRGLERWEIPTFYPVGRPLVHSAPYRLLTAVSDYLEEMGTRPFSNFIRHPDVGEWLIKQGLPHDWLTQWDRKGHSLLQQHTWLPKPDLKSGNKKNEEPSLRMLIANLLAPFTAEGKIPLTEWGDVIRKFFVEIYGQKQIHPDDQADNETLDACSLILKTLDENSLLPKEFDVAVSATEALRITLGDIGGEPLSPPRASDALQLTGWLDMPLDDAPVAIITSFNEGFVPSSVNHDLFLPNRLREHLGIVDNHRRYARDAYALTVLLHSRKEVQLLASRRNQTGDPLTPSRLLFAAPPEEIAKRILAFYSSSENAAATRSPLRPAKSSQLPIPVPAKLQQPKEEFRVTEFRDYLTSPYRYYLRHILKLNELSDAVCELDSLAFGNLIHDVLQEFGQSPFKNSSNPKEISDFLNDSLGKQVDETYGKEPMAAVLIQVEQAQRRLNEFAHWQARWRQSGWAIHFVENEELGPVSFPVGDGREVKIKGRIDRIDYHADEDQWAIFDYKTGDQGNSPEQTHLYHGEWADLQLPLYRHLAKAGGVSGEVQLGYLVLPREADGVKELFARWGPDELAHADDVARDVIRKILAEEFWVELPRPPATLTEYQGICQQGVFGQEIRL